MRASMLRYVFDTAAQLLRHVHARDGAALLFFPDNKVDQHAGERVMLEMQLRESRQQMVLRATIHSRVAGARPGVWLQFSDLHSRAVAADRESLRRRRHPRVGSDVMVEVREPDASARIARLLDVSAGGARVGATPGLRIGMAVDVHLVASLAGVPRAIGRATVVRVTGSEVGLQFAPDATARMQKLVDTVRASWAAAQTIAHPRGCCAGGAIDEPPIPHARPHKQIH